VSDGIRRRPCAARAACVALALPVTLAFLLPAPATAASLFLQVNTPAITLTPSAADYARDYVEVMGSAGIQLRIKTNDPVGMTVLVRCSDAAPRIALNDFLIRTPTGPGPGGASLATYTPIQSTNLFLWSTGDELAPFFIVTTDIRIRNLMNYDDSAAGGITGYTNTLVFTVVSP
jgi:hypothetical protein